MRAVPRIISFLLDRAGGEPRRITDGKSRNIAPAWSPIGRALGLEQQYPQWPRHGPVSQCRPAIPISSEFKEVSGEWTVADWSPDGHEDRRSKNSFHQRILSPHHRNQQRAGPRRSPRGGLTPGPSRSSPAKPKWSQDGKSIYYISDKDSEFRRLVPARLVSGSDTVITSNIPIPWDVESFDLSDDGQFIALVANEEGVDVLHGFHTATGKEFARAQITPTVKYPE